MGFINDKPSFISKRRNYRIPQKCSTQPFKRKERKSILTNQKYFDLQANVDSAEKTLKDIIKECDLLTLQQNKSRKAYEVAKKDLSKIATEKAILEAENAEIDEELCDRYQQAKISFITEKQNFEMLKTKSVSGKKQAEQNLELAQKKLLAFLLAYEEKLIIEKAELEAELKEAYEIYGCINNTIRSIQDDLNQVKKALSFICASSWHDYEKIKTSYDSETFRCKRCGDVYTQDLPAVWADK